MKTRPERFDEAFKMLLTVMTLSLSTSIAFYKGIVDVRFFLYGIASFVIAIILWVVPTLYGGEREYFVKVLGWWFLMLSIGSLYTKVCLTTFTLPPLVVDLVFIVDLALTLPIMKYLKESIDDEGYYRLGKYLIIPTASFILVDVLTNLGLF